MNSDGGRRATISPFLFSGFMNLPEPVSIPLPPDRAQSMAEFFAMLADANRLRILDLLAESEHCVQDIAIAVGMTEAAVSQQLRYLRANRIVRHEKRGRQVFYQLADHHIIGIYRSVAEHIQEHNCG
jgi:ArsR family transcriptional regulator, lead/cadmium/zinc/bismuth-responsive transcriptional repressor